MQKHKLFFLLLCFGDFFTQRISMFHLQGDLRGKHIFMVLDVAYVVLQP